MSIRKLLGIQRVIPKDNCEIGIEAMKFSSFDSLSGFKPDDSNDDESIELEQQARIILDQAQSVAEEIINKAQVEADTIKKDAFQSGYNNGINDAKKEVEEVIWNITQVFTNALNQLSAVKDELLKNAENDIIELTLAMSRKLVCSELRENPDLITDVIKEAIKIARTDDEIIIRINPNDRIFLEQNAKELMDYLKSATFNPTAKIILEDDQTMTQGGCVVITDTNVVDMSFESRFESMLETINSQREKL
jgi:flagellar assembly protein FliH